MEKVEIRDITGIPETMLITLWCRANETKREDSIIKDHKALEMISAIDYDFSRFEKAWMSQIGTRGLRTS